MSWQKWVLAGFISASTLTTVATVGKPKPTMTGQVAAVILVLNTFLVWCAVTA